MKSSVLFVYHSSAVGGGSYCLLNLLKAIDRTSFYPSVVLPEEGPLCNEIEKLEIPVYFLPGLTTVPYNNSLFSIDSIRRITSILSIRSRFLDLLKKLHPNIVYINSMMLYPLLKISYDFGSGTVIHIREHWNKGEHLLQRNHAIKSISKYASQIIAINSFSASMFSSVSDRVSIVYDWIDLKTRRGGPRLDDIIKGNNNNLKVYLFTGGIQPVKGTLEVLTTFTNKIKDDNNRLIALGVSKQNTNGGVKNKIKRVLSLFGYKSYAEKVIEVCDMDDRIVCSPAVYKLTDLLEQVDAYISYFTIPHANLALAESLIIGIPSLAASTPESVEYASASEKAFLYKFGDIDAFQEAWTSFDKYLKRDGSKSKEPSQKVAKLFDPQFNAEVFNNVLKLIIR